MGVWGLPSQCWSLPCWQGVILGAISGARCGLQFDRLARVVFVEDVEQVDVAVAIVEDARVGSPTRVVIWFTRR
jgi:hypothetical protein